MMAVLLAPRERRACRRVPRRPFDARSGFPARHTRAPEPDRRGDRRISHAGPPVGELSRGKRPAPPSFTGSVGRLMDITSSANPRIKRLVALRDRKERERESVFIVEGSRDLARAVAHGHQPLEIYYDPGHFPGPPQRRRDRSVGGDAALDRASYRGRSQGVIGVFGQFDVTLDHLAPGPDPLFLMAEAIEKPGNLGGLLRTADAVGAGRGDRGGSRHRPLQPERGSSIDRAIFSVPMGRRRPGCRRLLGSTAWARIVAAVPGASDLLWDADLTGPLALLVGARTPGSLIGTSAAGHQHLHTNARIDRLSQRLGLHGGARLRGVATEVYLVLAPNMCSIRLGGRVEPAPTQLRRPLHAAVRCHLLRPGSGDDRWVASRLRHHRDRGGQLPGRRLVGDLSDPGRSRAAHTRLDHDPDRHHRGDGGRGTRYRDCSSHLPRIHRGRGHRRAQHPFRHVVPPSGSSASRLPALEQ